MVDETGQALSDALAREVMGWTAFFFHWQGTDKRDTGYGLADCCCATCRLWHPHEDIAQAVEAAEKLCVRYHVSWAVGRCWCSGRPVFEAEVSLPSTERSSFHEHATSPAEALCRALLAYMRKG